jgi:prepilin-type N-terminal cleavage/methylation domain-containing protein
MPVSGRRSSRCPSPGRRRDRGTTLIEVITALSVMSIVVSSLYLLLGAGVRGRLIVHARVSDQERGRVALAWIADRVRQAAYDGEAACPDGLLVAGSGDGFDQRLAFRAVVDGRLSPPRRVYVYYAQDRVLWEEVVAEAGRSCVAEATRAAPQARRRALTPNIVKALQFEYIDGHGLSTTDLGTVRSVGITLALETPSTPGRTEVQTYRTMVTLRGP